MRASEILFENPTVFYHGSMEHLPVGTILTPRGEDYERDWAHNEFYQSLETYRPEGMLSHKDAVFMCDNPDDIDNAGGGTEYLFTVVPLGAVQKHDINWGSEIECIVSDHYGDDGDEDVSTSSEVENKIKQCALNYWNGVPHTDESVWEYLTPRAQITAVEEY
jgi:hypothetical protein